MENIYLEKPDFWNERFQKFASYGRRFRDRFIADRTGTIIDIGAGPGAHAIWLKESGLDVTCLDNAPPLISLCRSKGLKTICADMRDIPVRDESFDSAWAYASLLHIPKPEAPEAIAEIRRILKPHGKLAIGMKQGFGERKIKDRFFAFYQPDELDDLIEGFVRESLTITPAKVDFPFISAIYRKV